MTWASTYRRAGKSFTLYVYPQKLFGKGHAVELEAIGCQGRTVVRERHEAKSLTARNSAERCAVSSQGDPRFLDIVYMANSSFNIYCKCGMLILEVMFGRYTVLFQYYLVYLRFSLMNCAICVRSDSNEFASTCA